jgi:hypothetical protein
MGILTKNPDTYWSKSGDNISNTNSGNVGIGTTTPNQKLHVYNSTNGSNYVRIENPNSGASAIAGIILTNDSGTGGTQQVFSSNYGAGLANTYRVRTDSGLTGGIVLDTGSASAPIQIRTNGTTRVYIDTSTNGGNVGIGGTPNANAILDVQSTTKAFMPPRMTTAQKNAIASPTAGMVVYDSTLNKLCVYTGAAWETITSA